MRGITLIFYRLLCDEPQKRSAFIHCYVMVWIIRSLILSARTDQTVIVKLFDDVGGPSADAGDGEYWGEHIFVDAQDVVGGSGVEIHVGIQLLFCFHKLFDLV